MDTTIFAVLRSKFEMYKFTVLVFASVIALPLLMELAGNKIPEEQSAKVNSPFAPGPRLINLTTSKPKDGLPLASGFDDDQSCISRHQFNLYRKTSPHRQSQHLILKLRDYEDRHRACGPLTEAYNRTVKALLHYGHFNGTVGCNYIVWLPSNGLGNRIISMASAFLYAVLTNRVLLVDHGTDMADLFCEPFLGTSWLLPADFPLRKQLYSSSARHDDSYGNMLKNRKVNNSSLTPMLVRLHLAHDSNDDDKRFFDEQSQTFLQKVPCLIIESDQYFVPSLFLIPSFEQELNELFPHNNVVFHHLVRYLFHPSNQAWGLITRFYRAYLAKASKRIGLQIRVFNPKTSPSHAVMKQILACAEKEKLLPQLGEHKNSTFPSKNQTSIAILIASLQSDYYETIKNMYWMKPTVHGEAIGVYQPSHEENQQFGDNEHNMKAWAEIYILSFSDVLVTSSWSTFGYVAQGIGGLRPWILYMPFDQTIPDPPCQRAVSMEPCFHFPPRFHQKRDSILEAGGAVVHHVTHCEDVGWGVKLIDAD